MAFQLVPFLIQLAIGVGLQILGYLLMGKPKGPKPDEVKDLENPTAEAGRPIPVVFGEVEVTGVNIIYFGDKSTKTFEVKA
jgi:hypothetical protein